MIEWLFIILLLLCPRRGAYPSSAAARRAWEREAEGNLFKGSVIGGNPQFVHHYEQGAQGTRHSISLRGGISISPSLRRKVWQRKWHILLSLGLVVITVLTGLPTVLGVTKTWVGSGANKWNTAANWSPSGVPIDGDDVVLDSTDTSDCNLDVNTANLNSFTMDTGYTGECDLSASWILRVEYTADGSDFTGTEGTLAGASGTIKVSGTWSTSSVNFTFTRETCTVDLTGTGNVSARSGSHAFNNLTCGASGKTSTILTYVEMQGTLTIGAGTLARSGAQYAILHNATTPLVNSGTISCHITYAQSSAVTILGTTYGGNLWIQLADGVTATLGGAVTVSVALYVYPATANWTVTLKTDGYGLTAASIRVGHGGDPTKNGILDCDAAAIDINGIVEVSQPNSYLLLDTCTFNFSGHWTSNSTHASWDEGTSVVKADGSAAQNIDNNGLDFYDLHLSGTGQKNFTGSLTTNDVRALNNVQVNITDTGVTWTTFNGAQIYADATYTLTLRSTITDNAWDMVAGTGNVALRVDVKDSNNTGTDVDATDASNTNSGGNTGWNFVGGEIVTLAGSTAGQSGASGPLKLTMEIIGSAAGLGGADAALKATRKLIGSTDGQSAVSAVLKRIRDIIGSAAGQSGATGDLSVTAIVTLQGSSAGQSGVSGALKVVREIGGVIAAQSGADAALKVMRELAGIVEAQSAASAPLKLTVAFIGSADAVSSLVGDLTVAISAARTELELSVNISTALAFDGPLHRSLALDGTIARTKELEVEL